MRQALTASLFALLLCAPTGCLYLGQNPADFPFFLPAGGIYREHAKPPGHGYWANFDADAIKLDVHPLDSSSPVGSQFLVVASVLDADGHARRRRRIEWMLEGAGHIIEVDESGYLNGRGYKVDNRYAVSFSSLGEHTLKRGAGSADDVTILPGQTWCVITSATEGDSFLTVYAPGIADWNQHKVVVAKHWVDCQLKFPPPAVSRAGDHPGLTTQVTRSSDRQPVVGYKVRYRILEGPRGELLPSHAAEAVVASDASGNATVQLASLTSQPGTHRVAVEVLRPDPANPQSAGVVVGRGETSVEWQTAQLALEMRTASAAVNGDLPVTLAVSNTGGVTTGPVATQLLLPAGLQLVRTDPPAQTNGAAILWQLPAIEGGGKRELTAVFRSPKPASLEFIATAQSQDGQKADARAKAEVATGGLLLKLAGPEAATVGDAVMLNVNVTNPGSGPAQTTTLQADLDAGFTHESGQNKLKLELGTVAPGETKTIQLAVTAKQAGQSRITVRATAAGDLRAAADYALTVRAPRLDFNLSGPARLGIDRPGSWDVRLRNAGEVPLNNVQVRVQLPPGLEYVSSTGGKFDGGQVVWQVGSVPAGQQQPLQFIAQARSSLRGSVKAIVSSDRAADQQAESALEVLGLPAAKVDVRADAPIVDVGGRATYTVRVLNAGTLALVRPQLSVSFAPGVLAPRFGVGPTISTTNGNALTFVAMERLEPGQASDFRVEALALKEGDGRVRAELKADNLPTPLVQEEATRVTASGQTTALPNAVDNFRAPASK